MENKRKDEMKIHPTRGSGLFKNKKLDFEMGEMKFLAKVYRVNKGKKNLPSYKAVLKRDVVKQLNIFLGDAIFIKFKKDFFPAVISKIRNGTNSFVYCFTVPRNTGKFIKNKTEVIFELIAIAEKLKKYTKSPTNFFSVCDLDRCSINKPFYVFNTGGSK